SANRAIVPILWGDRLGPIVSQGYDCQVRTDWRFIPESLNDLIDWANVVEEDEGHDGAAHRLYHLVYAVPVGDDGDSGDCTVTLVLQGFLGAHALGVLGNWRGKERDAQSAVQFLVLESGGCEVAFQPQVSALQNIRRLIAMRIGGDVVDSGDNSSIMLRRRVFQRVRPTDEEGQGIRLTDAVDPFGKARAMSSRWRVDHKIVVSVRRPNGSTLEVVPDVLKHGDFVEVTATARVEVLRSRKRRGVMVQFEMHEVVRLLTGQEAK
ncbi:hypothetical protein FKP32DRAFT_1533715, partial [Trametes sanguinea]